MLVTEKFLILIGACMASEYANKHRRQLDSHEKRLSVSDSLTNRAMERARIRITLHVPPF